MHDPVLRETLGPASDSRLDLFIFIGTFLTGFAAYLAFRKFELHPAYATAAVVLVLVLYAIVVSKVPRLRVRLDQAGDNAYYLGLLFTLASMALALYDFGAASMTEGAAPRSGSATIIRNFGIALASTITGIFLRVILHQMRVDPADVESMTRIELAEAATRVRATLGTVASDMARFHEEVRQRTDDVATTVLADLKHLLTTFVGDVEAATRDLVGAAEDSQRNLLERTTTLNAHLEETAGAAAQAIERLNAVEPPPTKLAARLEKTSGSLESVARQAEHLIASFARTEEASARIVGSVEATAATLGAAAHESRQEQAAGMRGIAEAAKEFRSALGAAGLALKENLEDVHQLKDNVRVSSENAAQAQQAASETIAALAEAARDITAAIKDATGGGQRQ